MNKEINIYFYSGTGNTLLIVKELEKSLKENSIVVNLYKIEETDPILLRINQ